jgi:NAD(P)H-dependent FMN reductase
MKTTIIVGSHRNESQSTKVGEYIGHILSETYPTDEQYIFNLKNNPLPLWSEDKWEEGETEIKKLWKPISQELKTADSFIIISPEWSGMVPAGLKNFFLMCDKQELAHKPALIISVSASRGGRYPIAELRMSSYKNTRICYIPDHVIIEHVNDVLNDTKIDESNKSDFYIKQRLNYSLNILHTYATAFVQIRESDVFNHKKFPHGM